MTEDNKTPLETAVEQAIDAFVYAPIGLIFDGAAVFPELVAKGKQQVATARMFGQFAVQAAESEASKRAGTAHEQVRDLLSAFGIVPPKSAPVVVKTPPAPTPETAPTPPATPAPAVEGLSIPDYESLSASQVVSRLSGLAPAELEHVRLYEAAKRGRKTILNKIAQLQK